MSFLKYLELYPSFEYLQEAIDHNFLNVSHHFSKNPGIHRVEIVLNDLDLQQILLKERKTFSLLGLSQLVDAILIPVVLGETEAVNFLIESAVKKNYNCILKIYPRPDFTLYKLPKYWFIRGCNDFKKHSRKFTLYGPDNPINGFIYDSHRLQWYGEPVEYLENHGYTEILLEHFLNQIE